MFNYIHRDSSIKTIKELVETPISILKGINQLELLSFECNGIQNIERIYKKYNYTKGKGKSVNEAKFEEDLKLLQQYSTIGYDQYAEANGRGRDVNLQDIAFLTELFIPEEKLNIDVLPFEGDALFSNNYKEFLGREIDRIRQGIVGENIVNLVDGNQINEIYQKVTIWVWPKSSCLNMLREGSQLENSSFDLEAYLLDVTPFVFSATTNVGNFGGDFNIELLPILGEWSSAKKKWIRDSKLVFSNKEYINIAHIINKERKIGSADFKFKQQDFYYQNILGENDIVFIRFDELGSEQTERKMVDYKEEILLSEIPNKIYDMIGLIDSVFVGINPQSNDVTISVKGRDLTKLVVEDNCYFFPIDYIQGENGIFANARQARAIQRYSGKIQGLAQSSIKTLGFAMKFVFNALSNMGVCPDDVFKSYINSKFYKDDTAGDRRTHKFNLNIEDKIDRNERGKRQKELFAKIEEAVKESRKLDDLTAESTTIENDTSNKVAGDCNRFLNAATQDFYKNDSRIKETVTTDVDWRIFTWHTPIFNEEELVGESVLSKIFVGMLCNGKYQFYWNGAEITDVEAQQKKKEYQDAYNLYKKWEADYKITAASTGSATANVPDQWSQTEYDAAEKRYFKGQMSQEEWAEWQQLLADYVYSQTSGVQDEIGKTADGERQSQLAIMGQEMTIAKQKMDVITNGLSSKIFPPNLSQINVSAKNALNLSWQFVKEMKSLQARKDKYTEEPCRGIWQIVKLIIDDENDLALANRRLVDSSLGNESGTLFTQLKKVCKEPFVEMYADTYYDQFYFIVRQPPFDYGRISEMIPHAVNISSSNVYSLNLEFERKAYSWYRLIPKGFFSGKNNEMVFAFIKAVLFEEYANIWGDNALEVVTNYIPYRSFVSDKGSMFEGSMIRQLVRDLKYVVDTNCYLPFTRRGTITIVRDRRIKRGNFIRLETTGEIYHVDAVNHSYRMAINSIDGYTSLQVSRGMFEEYIKNPDISDLSYFKIVRTPIDESGINDKTNFFDWKMSTLGKWKVDLENFNFFLRRRNMISRTNYSKLEDILTIEEINEINKKK